MHNTFLKSEEISKLEIGMICAIVISFFIVQIIGMVLAFKGGNEYSKNSTVLKMIIGIILSGIWLGVITAFIGYKQAEKEKKVKKKLKKLKKVKKSK